MKLFFLFDRHNPSAAEAARRFAAAAEGHEISDLSSPERKTQLSAARALVVFFDNIPDTYSWELERHWDAFQNELALGNKTEGSVIAVLGADVRVERLHFGFAPNHILHYGEENALREILTKLSGGAETPNPAPAIPDTAAATQNPAPQNPAVPPKPAAPKNPAIAFPKPIPKPALQSTRGRKSARKALRIFRRVLDWVWLAALLPLSWGVLYGVAVPADMIMGQRFFLLLLFAAFAAFALRPAAFLPFGESKWARRCVKYVELAAVLSCIVFDSVYIGFYAPDGGVYRVIFTALLPLAVLGIKTFYKRVFRRYTNFSPFAAYFAAHSFDYYAARTGAAVLWWTPVILAALLIGFIAQTALAKKRALCKWLRPLCYAAFIFLFFIGLYNGPYF